MTIEEQSALLLNALEMEIIKTEDLVKWADALIARDDNPLEWIILLSILNPSHPTEFLSALREHAAAISRRHLIQLPVLAYQARLLSLPATLSNLFNIIIGPEKICDQLEDKLGDLLAEWDCQENLDPVEPALQGKFFTVFKAYLADANEVAALLPWKFINKPTEN